MRRILLWITALMLCSGNVWAAQSTPVPQTARQALIEMFFSKTPGTLLKHLPIATRNALEQAGALASVQQYSLMVSQLKAQGQNVQTFETGSVLLTAEDPKTGQKTEITVENDALSGDHDDIELSFHTSKNGEEQWKAFKPQVTFSMKQEDQIWKLNEISVTLRFPLADPDFLKTITEGMKAARSTSTLAVHSEPTMQSGGSDALVLQAMRSILAAEATYAKTYPTIGFTCTLSDLDGFGASQPNEHQAMLINSGLASGKRYGYVFGLSSCSGAPATGFRMTAVPNPNTLGRKTFCADQSAVIRSLNEGNPANCLANGIPVQ